MLFCIFEQDTIDLKIVQKTRFYCMKLRKTNLSSKLVYAGDL